MTQEHLLQKLQELLADWEGECVEFKRADDNFSTSDIGKYFSALSNEANLKSLDAAWLVFGIDNQTGISANHGRPVVGHALLPNLIEPDQIESNQTLAVSQLDMVDTMGWGIREVLFRQQAQCWLPLPDYDLSEPDHVTMHLPGRLIDENYSRALLVNGDFTLKEILALDRVQKHLPIDNETLHDLRRRGLVEGRKPNIHVSASVAAATGGKAEYILTRQQDDSHYQQLILDYLAKFKQASREELRSMLAGKWPEILTEKQREDKLHNLLAALKRQNRIERKGGFSNARWQLVPRVSLREGS